MRLRVKLRTLVVLATASVCVVLYNVAFVHLPSHNTAATPYARPARITADDLLAIGHSSGLDSISPQPVAIPNIFSASQHPSLTHAIFNTSAAAPCDADCQLARERSREARVAVASNLRTQHPRNSSAQELCDRACRMKKLMGKGHTRDRGYASRVQVENVTLPQSWTVTRELVDRLSQRRRHVQETCKKYGLNKPTSTYQPNAWEFLISEKHNLVWCNVFKAASSTWFYNFNLLAGFSETELLHTKESPISLARKRYKRPTVEELQQAFNGTHKPLAFMIARHPLKRLVSGYRDKILSGNRYYSKLSRTVAKNYRDMGPPVSQRGRLWPKAGRPSGIMVVASFPQFVQFLLDETSKGNKLDEHWTPMHSFCTPCLVPFDVFAKVETLQEDGNYVIFSSGIEDIIKPKRINRARDEPTDEVADKFLCQLTKDQMEGLINMYKLDLELFQYDVSKYRECTQNNLKNAPNPKDG